MLKSKKRANRLRYITENICHLPKNDRVVGFYLYDRFNDAVARIDAVLAEATTYLPRYLVVSLGGFLGVEGKKVLLPTEICEVLDMGKVKTHWRKESLMGAPTPIDVEDVSMNEEELILGYFDFEPYWKVNSSEEEEQDEKNPSNQKKKT